MVAKEQFDINKLTRGELSKLVHRTIFSETYKNFSGAISDFARDYGASRSYNTFLSTIVGSIQEGLFGEFGDDLRDTKRMPRNGIIPDYMTNLEIRMYTEALTQVQKELYDLMNQARNSKKIFYDYVKQTAQEVYETYDLDYKNGITSLPLLSRDAKERLLDKSGENMQRANGCIKNFQKGLKLSKYHKILRGCCFEQHSFPEEIKAKYSTQGFDPNSVENKKSYDQFKLSFINIVEELQKIGFGDTQISMLFDVYDEAFYNTTYLKNNEINIMKYMSGLTDGVYFSRLDFNEQVAKLNAFTDCLNHGCKTMADFHSALQKKAINERRLAIKNQYSLKTGRRPEISPLFLTACLDFIANEQKFKDVALEDYVDRYSTQLIQKLPNSMIVLAHRMKDKFSACAVKQPEEQPELSLFDLHPEEFVGTEKKSQFFFDGDPTPNQIRKQRLRDKHDKEAKTAKDTKDNGRDGM